MGTDTVSYFDVTTGVTVNLSLAGAQNTVGAGTDTITTIENATGTNLVDTLTGTTGTNTLYGKNGGDTLSGGDGNDTLLPGHRQRHRERRGGPGHRELLRPDGRGHGEPVGALHGWCRGHRHAQPDRAGHRDELRRHLDRGRDLVNILNGLGGNDSIFGLDGNDTLDGGANTDSLDGGIGTDTCKNGESNTNCEL